MKDLTRIPALTQDEQVHVVVEVPRGAQVKLKYVAAFGTFQYVRPLPQGLVYPFDWGFIPSTCGEDGDPLDAMVIHHAPTAPGTVIRCRLIGVLAVEQAEGGKVIRNDRYFCCPVADSSQDHLRTVADLDPLCRQELEQFFVAAVVGTGKTLRFRGWKNEHVALEGVWVGLKAHERKHPE